MHYEKMQFEERLSRLMTLVNSESNPNGHELSQLAREVPSICLNIKFFGYHLARQIAEALPPRKGLALSPAGLRSQASTQADIASDWVAYWCQQARIPVVFHRKIWELCYVLQAAREHGKLQPGIRAIGFGCGMEVTPSLLASQGVEVLVTDLPPEDARVACWTGSAQHTTSLANAFYPDIVDAESYRRLVRLRYLDMNAIPDDLREFDLCWSICALEHLGSIRNGLDFIEQSLKVLKVGGMAVHTTEYNFARDDMTIDNWATVLFQRKHFQEIFDRLTAAGHFVQPLDFSVGNGPLDKFIDIPPYLSNLPDFIKQEWDDYSPHIKLSIDGFPCTCFGLIVTKGR